MIEVSDYMRRIGEHFISFIRKLDQYYTQEEIQDDTQQEWLNKLARYLCAVLCLKYNRIKKIGDKVSADQLVSDIAYFKKLMVQFG